MPVSSIPDERAPACPRRRRSVHPEYALTVRCGQLPADTASRVASLFAILADPTRLQVVYALLNAPGGELCVGDLAAGLGRDDTTISHQLRVLRSNHLVAIRKAGRVVYYRLVDEHIRQVLSLGLMHARESLPPSSQASEAVSL
jgi:DNA-binding transcriptional ArsR family regulator